MLIITAGISNRVKLANYNIFTFIQAYLNAEYKECRKFIKSHI